MQRASNSQDNLEKQNVQDIKIYERAAEIKIGSRIDRDQGNRIVCKTRPTCGYSIKEKVEMQSSGDRTIFSISGAESTGLLTSPSGMKYSISQLLGKLLLMTHS